MPHHTPLIATIVAGLGIAFIFGTIAHRLKLPPIAGYLLAGVLIGPFTPGYVADQHLALELAEIGVILLMFGVGLHFSLKDLLSVRAIAIPGAVGQIAIATLLGMALAWALGWDLGAGIVLGLSLSTASTVVLLKAMQDHRLIETERGRIAVGWLIVEDLAMVLTLVILPAVAGLIGGREIDAGEATGGAGLAALFGPPTIWHALALTALKLTAFVALMIVVGRRLVPWILHYIAHTGSRELFRLAVLAIALGIAFGSAQLFGVSFALGAFFAGMIMAESALSHQAAQETLPLRDAFAVLFFVSVGMLFNPSIIVSHPFSVIATILIIVIGKSLAAYGIVRLFGHSNKTALTISTSLAQIGEFAFILAAMGVSLQLLPNEGRDLVLAGAIISILLNPLLFTVMMHYLPRQDAVAAAEPEPKLSDVADDAVPDVTLTDHAVVIGYGRVGKIVVDALLHAGIPMAVIDERPEAVIELKGRGVQALSGNAGERGVLEATNLPAARWFVSAIPSPFEAGGLIEHARAANPGLDIVARAHSDAEVEYLEKAGASRVIMAERETAGAMIEYVLGRAPEPKMDATP
jgi:CPA2 family monovalent cation:H+ antiporter-2